jgi:hypothetical protein
VEGKFSQSLNDASSSLPDGQRIRKIFHRISSYQLLSDTYPLYSEVFLDRIQSQEEIHRLIEEVFGERKRISLEEFQEIVEKITSEMFLAVTIFKFNHYYLIDCDPLAIVSTLQ